MLKHILDCNALIKIYFAFIRPILEYDSIVLDNCSQENSVLLENVQVAAGRIITGLRKNSSRNALYSELGWEPLSIRRERQKLLMFYKIVHGIAPHYLQELLLPFYRPTHSYNLRNADNLNFVIPQTRTVSYYNSFFTISYSVMEWTTIGNKMY